MTRIRLPGRIVIAGKLLGRKGGERVAETRSRRDTELGEGSVEVTADSPGRQEQPLRDLLVRQTRRSVTGDLEFLGHEPASEA